jgi:hypothetical protein
MRRIVRLCPRPKGEEWRSQGGDGPGERPTGLASEVALGEDTD